MAQATTTALDITIFTAEYNELPQLSATHEAPSLVTIVVQSSNTIAFISKFPSLDLESLIFGASDHMIGKVTNLFSLP